MSRASQNTSTIAKRNKCKQNGDTREIRLYLLNNTALVAKPNHATSRYITSHYPDRNTSEIEEIMAPRKCQFRFLNTFHALVIESLPDGVAPLFGRPK